MAAAGTLPELLGRQQLDLRLGALGPELRHRLAAVSEVIEHDASVTLVLPAGADFSTVVPEFVAGLVGLGVRVHAVEPGRISLEDRLLDLVRGGAGKEQP